VGVLQKDLQEITHKNLYKKVGSVDSTMVKGGTDWILLTYADGDRYNSHCNKSKRQAHVMIVCDPTKLKVCLHLNIS